MILWVKCGKTRRIPFYIKYQRWPQLRLEYKINRLMIAWGQTASLLILLIFTVQALVMDNILNVPNRLTWWSLVPQMMLMLWEVLETRSQDLTRGNRSLGFLGDILVSGPFLVFLLYVHHENEEGYRLESASRIFFTYSIHDYGAKESSKITRQSTTLPSLCCFYQNLVSQ